MRKLGIFSALAVLLFGLSLHAQTANANYPENQLLPGYASDTGAVNVLAASPAAGCPSAYSNGMVLKVLPGHANTTTTPTINWCGLGAKTITKFGQAALATSDLVTTAVAVMVYDGTDMELLDPNTLSSNGTVTSIATTGPISGGTITTTGTISCPTCVTSAASLANLNLMVGSGSQGSQTLAGDVLNSGGVFTTYNSITTAGLGFPVVEGTSDVTAQTASQTTVNLVASTGAAGHYLVRLYMDQNALCTTGQGSVLATVSWTDASHAHTATTVPLTLTNTAISGANGFVDAAIPLWAASATAISYTTTYTACATGTGSYDLHAEVERTN